MVDVSALTSGTAVQSTENASRNKLAKDLDSFLTLLTSQLKNQDPLSPMDSTEFTNQLVQFAQVEQAINSNESLTSLISLSQQSIVTNAVNYIGKTVEANSSKVPLQDGQAKMAYGLAADAQSVAIVIRNEAGTIVYSTTGEKTKGVHPLDWDGKDNMGIQQPDGTYEIQVTALSKNDEAVETYTTVFGKVSGVTQKEGQTLLVMDKIGVPIDKVLSITG
ncbi:MAG: flagellar hook assembly protein FlgD [Rhodospirillaceae bacterium]|nr:flagellar hook assembly protein FlgD [Rhodospirillaceae bacterium]